MSETASSPNLTSAGMKTQYWHIAVLVLSLLACWYGYQPGLDGEFLLDDPPNLDPLKEFNSDPTWENAYKFASKGKSGPSGRPLSMASFLLDASDYPDNAGRFRQTNLLLHLINGLLLFAVMFRLAPYLGRYGTWIALGTAVLWILHPIHTATTLYVVQRMVLLSATFTLLGIWLYLIGRSNIEAGKLRTAAALMAAGLGVGLIIGILAKENAVLLPALLLGLEFSLLPARTFTGLRTFRVIQLSALLAPLIALAGYLLSRWPNFMTAYSWRPFSAGERMLTEARALLDYATTIIYPRPSQISVFHDGYQISTSLIDPPLTLLAVVFWLLVIGLSLYFRRVYPVLAGGAFWYLSNHILESTILPLELYFDHRNYLASAGLLLIIVFLLARISVKNAVSIATLSIAALAGLYAFQTYSSATSYGDPLQAAIIWPEEQPQSSRVRQFSATTWLSYGDYYNAEKQIEEATKYHPKDTMLWLQLAQMQCAQQKDTKAAIQNAIATASIAPVNIGMLYTFYHLRDMVKNKRCNTISIDQLLTVINLLMSNPYYTVSDYNNAQIHHIRAQLLAGQGKYDQAVAAIEEIRKYRSDIRIRFWQYIWLTFADNKPARQDILELARKEASRPDATDDQKKEYDVMLKMHEKLTSLPGNGYLLVINPEKIEKGQEEISARKSESSSVKIEVVND